MQALLSKFCAVFSKLQLHSHTNNNSQHSKLKFLVPVATYCAIIIIINNGVRPLFLVPVATYCAIIIIINNGVRPLTRHAVCYT